MAEPHSHPDHLWRNPEPKRSYEVVIIGAGGHGLATAYYLAKNHGISDVAVLERGWLAGGNMARNTTVIRSNYLWDESAAIYEHSLKLWEHLSEELDYEILLSQRGVLGLVHSLGDQREGMRRVNANRLNGIDAEWLTPAEVKAFCPIVNISPDVRYPVIGGTLQRRGGIAKHDYVAWAFARKADMIGVDLPIESHPLQALVSELLQPVLNCVVMSNAVHVYVSQAPKGELVMGAGMDPYTSYAQRGSPHVIEYQLAAACELFPIFSRAHVLRTWAGIVDVSPDASPILGLTPIENLFINCGWGSGGFKATPGAGWVYAHTRAHGEPHPLSAPFTPERFTTGALIDEHGAAGVAH